MRICSFLPSATEILYALGLGEDVAGVTYECDYPAEVRQKPVVVRTRLAPTSSASELDRQVVDFVARGESLYRVDMEALERIAPDLLVTQDLCQVCAASPGDLADALARLPRRPEVLSLTPHSLDDVFADIERVGQATGRAGEAKHLAEELRAGVAKVEKQVAGSANRPRVLCLEWLDPPYIGGHWVPEMVERAGGRDILGRTGQPSRRVTWEEIVEGQPEVIVAMPCGYDLAETLKELGSMHFPPAWQTLPAVKTGRVYAVDATSYFSRPGPRLATGVALLASILHPERVSFSPPRESLAAI